MRRAIEAVAPPISLVAGCFLRVTRRRLAYRRACRKSVSNPLFVSASNETSSGDVLIFCPFFALFSHPFLAFSSGCLLLGLAHWSRVRSAERGSCQPAGRAYRRSSSEGSLHHSADCQPPSSERPSSEKPTARNSKTRPGNLEPIKVE
jgi:hypothetical protein